MAIKKQKGMKCECMPCMILGKAFLLTLAIFLAHYLSDIWGIEKMTVNGGIWGWIALFVWYMIFMVIGLKIIWLVHPKKA